jgi:hypothetical protein
MGWQPDVPASAQFVLNLQRELIVSDAESLYQFQRLNGILGNWQKAESHIPRPPDLSDANGNIVGNIGV